MSTRLQIILISIIALMAGLGFVASSLALNQGARLQLANNKIQMLEQKTQTPVPQTEKSTQASDQTSSSDFVKAAALIPGGLKIVSSYPLGNARYWFLADEDGTANNMKTESWIADASSSKAALIAKMDLLSQPMIQSLNIAPPISDDGYLVVERESAWESPLFVDMQVIGTDGTLRAATEWSETGTAKITKENRSLSLTWHFPKPCTLGPGDDNAMNVISDGFSVSVNGGPAQVLKFSKLKAVTCVFNEEGGDVQYEGFGRLRFQEEAGDHEGEKTKDMIVFSLKDKDEVSIDMAKLDPSGITVQSYE